MELLKKHSTGLCINISLVENTLRDLEGDFKEFAKVCADYTSNHPDWSVLAGRIMLEGMFEPHGQVPLKFSESTKKAKILLNSKYYDFVMNNAEYLDSIVDYSRDSNVNWFGLSTAIGSYLMKVKTGEKNNEKGEFEEIFQVIESPQQMYMRVAVWIGMHYPDVYFYKQGNLFDYIRDIYDDLSVNNYIHATPTLFNSGARRPSLSSCFLLTTQDSLEGISKNWYNCAMISKGSGGIGMDISDIRHSGIGGFGKSSGITPMLKIYNDIAQYVDQSLKRKGSIAIYLPDYHTDIFMFLEMKKNSGPEHLRAKDLFYAVWVSDIFMKRVQKDEMWSLFCPNIAKGLNDVWGEEFENLYMRYEFEKKYFKQVKARDLWIAMYNSWVEVGMPYVLFKDSCNRKSNQKNLGTIRSSNLCVSGDTKILTDKGQIEISTLKDKEVNVWNGQEFSKVVVRQTGENKDLLKITFSNGSELQCTPEHKFPIYRSNIGKHVNFDEVPANLLQIGDKLIKWNLPECIECDDKEDIKYPYTHGFFCGDGTTYCNYSKAKKYPKVTLYGNKKKLKDQLIYECCSEENPNTKTLNLVLPKDMKEKFYVPINTSLNNKLRWFEGYCDADGTIAKNNTNQSLQISCIHKNFLLDVKIMLQTMGVDAKVTLNKAERKELLPNGKGGQAEYNCKKLYRLLINSNDLYHLHTLGFSPKRLIYSPNIPQRRASQFVKVEKIEQGYKGVDTFCFTEKKRHMGIFNGILTMQCAEIVEYTSKDDIASCLTGDTQILTESGYKRIVECDGTSVYVPFNNDDDLNDNERYIQATLINQGKKDVYLIEFSGLDKSPLTNIKCTSDHKFLVLRNNNEWVNACDLKIDDMLMFIDPNGRKSLAFVSNVPQLCGNENVYDLFVPNAHHFVANGLIVHNCNLANIPLNKCVQANKKFNFSKLERLVRSLVRNINIVIDINFYHEGIPEIKNNNLKNRPMGIGVQGLADVFAMLDIPWSSTQAKDLNKKIFETMYYAAITESMKIAKERTTYFDGLLTEYKNRYRSLIELPSFSDEDVHNILNKIKSVKEQVPAYQNFEGSPISKGILQFDLWAIEEFSKRNNVSCRDVENNFFQYKNKLDYSFLKVSNNQYPVYDWDKVRQDVMRWGVRNSLCIALMPTASTAHLIGNNESFEPFTALIYARTVLSGQYMLVNKYLIDDMIDLGIWSKTLFEDIVHDGGSIQSLSLENYVQNPSEQQTLRFNFLKEKYKTAFEVSQKLCCELAVDRGRFVCQSQSFNSFMDDPSYQKVTSFLFYQWESGAKTGLYYLRTKPPANPLKIALGSRTKESKKEEKPKIVCTDEVCKMCQ